ncbi:interferon-induced protein 44-like [Haliotis rufescens]|uniref:interferon-induced protein 44-like n=1 Tax=Haliotis rufescens TaxID=6454 RepID=UPI00201E80A1|nr:interferon-induced protein 44-like [Haliotis rufescens]XP_046343281.2 interferon-induced protein 44-like [Haliotis rufescens]
MTMSFNLLCHEMLKEWLGDTYKFKILFDSSLYHNQIQEFHKRCDKSESTVTVFYTNGNSVFGGYTRQTWQPSSPPGHKRDPRAFLFKLYDRATFKPKKYPVDTARCAIYCHSDYGPTFGGGNVDGAMDIVTTEVSDDLITVRTAIGQAYNIGKRQNENFIDGHDAVVKFEVFLVIDDDEYVEKAWRNVSQVAVEPIKRELEGFEPPTEALEYTNILLVGQIGAGKSSYLNSVTSAFRGYVTSSVPTGSALHSLTQKNEEHKIFTWPGRRPLKFRFWDTRGFEQGMGQNMVYAIQHIIGGSPPGYMSMLATMMRNLWNKQPIRQQTLSEEDLLQQKVHCVAFVIDGSVIDGLPREVKEAFDQIKKTANGYGIPQTVLLSKIDKVCRMVDGNLSLTFHSTQIRDLVDQTAALIGLPRSHIFPVKNYEQESELDENVDRLTLLSLRQMLRFTDDFLIQQLQ